jgi:hypothetical protein
MASNEIRDNDSVSYEYGNIASVNKQFKNEFKYDRQAYVAPSSEQEDRDEIDLDELNELLGLDVQAPSKIDHIVSQLKTENQYGQPAVNNPYAKRSYF